MAGNKQSRVEVPKTGLYWPDKRTEVERIALPFQVGEVQEVEREIERLKKQEQNLIYLFCVGEYDEQLLQGETRRLNRPSRWGASRPTASAQYETSRSWILTRSASCLRP